MNFKSLRYRFWYSEFGFRFPWLVTGGSGSFRCYSPGVLKFFRPGYHQGFSHESKHGLSFRRAFHARFKEGSPIVWHSVYGRRRLRTLYFEEIGQPALSPEKATDHRCPKLPKWCGFARLTLFCHFNGRT